MTDETKNLFDAPWFPFSRACDFHGLKRSNGSEIFSDASLRSEVNRLARLPELYDALANAVRDTCQDCVDQVYDHPTDYDPVKQGCLFKDKNCCEMRRSWIELLQKVRDGE